MRLHPGRHAARDARLNSQHAQYPGELCWRRTRYGRARCAPHALHSTSWSYVTRARSATPLSEPPNIQARLHHEEPCCHQFAAVYTHLYWSLNKGYVSETVFSNRPLMCKYSFTVVCCKRSSETNRFNFDILMLIFLWLILFACWKHYIITRNYLN